MMTSDQGTQVLIALIAGLPATLTVVLAAWVQLRHARTTAATAADKAEQLAVRATVERAQTKAATLDVAHKVEYVAAQTAQVAEKVDAVAEQSAVVAQTVATVVAKTDEVHEMVNSRLSEALAEIERLRAMVEGLREGVRAGGGDPGARVPSPLGTRP